MPKDKHTLKLHKSNKKLYDWICPRCGKLNHAVAEKSYISLSINCISCKAAYLGEVPKR